MTKLGYAKPSIIFLLLAFIFISVDSIAQEKEQSIFIDTLDNHVDLSNYLLDLRGFLPVVSPITEPAVGYGATVAGLFFIPKEGSVKKMFQMPDIVGVMGGLTQNGTWFGGAGYFGFWNEDKIRYRGVVGYGDVNLTYYGSGIFDDYFAEFNLSGFFFLQQAIFRLGDSRFFLGGRYQLSKITTSVTSENKLPPQFERDFELTNSGVGVISEYENFNNLFSPTKGLRVNLTYDQYLKAIGSDREFGLFTFFTHYYLPVNNFWISGFRIESQLSTGDSPFYMLPFIQLRGIPAMRYQGDMTALIETEQLFMLSWRWGIVGFAGVGKTNNYDNKNELEAWNAGTGFRYLIARSLGLMMGIDVARGPEDWAVYVVFGSSWLK